MSQTLQNSDTPMKTEKKALEKDCIVFLPGIGGERIDQSIEGLTLRIASVLDTNAIDKSAEFYSKVRAAEENFKVFSAEIGTVYRKDDREDDPRDSPILDIYKLDYRQSLIERYEDRNLLIKALLLLLALPKSILGLLKAVFTGKSSKTRTEKIQLLYALGILSLLIVYVVILFAAIIATIKDSGKISQEITEVTKKAGDFTKNVIQQLSGSNNTPQQEVINKDTSTPTSTEQNTVLEKQANLEKSSWLLISQAIIVLSAAISLFLPPKFNIKDIISKASVDYLCLIYYLNLGERRNAIVGKLEVLIDEISRKSANESKYGKQYRNVHLFAYSFGSIIALDALFPIGREPGRALQSVHTLVTIGCPFDFVRTFWSQYFDNRRKFEKDVPAQWINVYSSVDVLASNFRNDSCTEEANINIRSEHAESDLEVPRPCNVQFAEGLDYSKLSWLDSFTLIGLRSHSMYWGAKIESEYNCFNKLVLKMYDGDEFLS